MRGEKDNKDNIVKLTIKISKELHRKMGESVKRGFYVSISELVRDAIKSEIRKIEEKLGEEL